MKISVVVRFDMVGRREVRGVTLDAKVCIDVVSVKNRESSVENGKVTGKGVNGVEKKVRKGSYVGR